MEATMIEEGTVVHTAKTPAPKMRPRRVKRNRTLLTKALSLRNVVIYMAVAPGAEFPQVVDIGDGSCGSGFRIRAKEDLAAGKYSQVRVSKGEREIYFKRGAKGSPVVSEKEEA